MSESSFLGTGWSFPPVFDNANHNLLLSSGVDNINQSIDLLLKTPKGSHRLAPNFGCNLFSYVFRRIDASLQEEMIEAVKSALLEGEPRIDVEAVNTAISADGITVMLAINYTVRQTNTRHNHVFPFSLLEGTNLSGSA